MAVYTNLVGTICSKRIINRTIDRCSIRYCNIVCRDRAESAADGVQLCQDVCTGKSSFQRIHIHCLRQSDFCQHLLHLFLHCKERICGVRRGCRYTVRGILRIFTGFFDNCPRLRNEFPLPVNILIGNFIDRRSFQIVEEIERIRGVDFIAKPRQHLIDEIRCHQLPTQLQTHVGGITFKDRISAHLVLCAVAKCPRIRRCIVVVQQHIAAIHGCSQIRCARILKNRCGGDDVIRLVGFQLPYRLHGLHAQLICFLEIATVAGFFSPIGKPYDLGAFRVFMQPPNGLLNLRSILRTAVCRAGGLMIVLHHDDIPCLFECVLIALVGCICVVMRRIIVISAVSLINGQAAPAHWGQSFYGDLRRNILINVFQDILHELRVVHSVTVAHGENAQALQLQLYIRVRLCVSAAGMVAVTIQNKCRIREGTIFNFHVIFGHVNAL